MGRQTILDQTVAAIPKSALSFFEPVILIFRGFPPPPVWNLPHFQSIYYLFLRCDFFLHSAHGDIKLHLVSLPFSSRPPSLLTTNKAIWPERCSSFSPAGRSRSELSQTFLRALEWAHRDTRYNVQTAPYCFTHAQFHNETGCFASHCCFLCSYVFYSY